MDLLNLKQFYIIPEHIFWNMYKLDSGFGNRETSTKLKKKKLQE